MLLCGSFLAAVAAALPEATAATSEAKATGPVVLRVAYDDIRDLARLQRYDLWEYNNTAARYVLVATDEAGQAALIREGWRVSLDVAATNQLRRPASRLTDLKGGYRTVDELYDDMDAVLTAHPQLTESVVYGQSYCLANGGCAFPGGATLPGYPLRAIRVTNEAIPGSSTVAGGAVSRGSKPVFFLMANIHAREITTPELAMRFLDLLLDGYGTDANVTWLVDYHEIWIVPTANPDGHWLVELGERPEYGGRPLYQRKNSNNDGDLDGEADCDWWPPSNSEPGSGEQFGIDLNRNHSFAWGGAGSSGWPCDLTYRGTGPASEMEVARLEALVRVLIADQRGPNLNDAAAAETTGLLITLHSFSNLVLYPWGHLYTDAPNETGLRTIAEKLVFYNGYLACQPTDDGCLYAAAGASDDWAYGELGIPAFTFEIGDQFMPDYDVIDAEQWPRNRPALLYAASIARTPYQTVHGPDVLEIVVAGIGPVREVKALVTDQANGNRPVVYAAYTIDAPPWEPGAVPAALAPADGAFDTAIESVEGLIDVSGLAPGRHLIYLRGQDADGNWGPVSAAFLDVALPSGGKAAFLPYIQK